MIDPVVERNRALLLSRSQVGVSKYGVTLGGAGLSRQQLLQHALEEALDLANYLQAELMREESPGCAPPVLVGADDVVLSLSGPRLQDDVIALLGLLEVGEWAEGCTKTPLGKRLEAAITDLHSDIHDARNEPCPSCNYPPPTK